MAAAEVRKVGHSQRRRTDGLIDRPLLSGEREKVGRAGRAELLAGLSVAGWTPKRLDLPPLAIPDPPVR